MEKTAMSVKELAEQMGISLPLAYELTRSQDFPSIHVGARILIPIDAFKDWLASEASHKN